MKRSASCLLLMLFVIMLPACTIVKIGEQETGNKGVGSSSRDAFDPEAYVKVEWAKVIPYMEERAADIKEVIAAISGDANQAGENYGIRSGASGSPWNFIVKAKGKVLAVHTESRAGTLEIDLPPYDDQMDMLVQIGPVFKGSSIRDSLDFISFDDFRNQIQYAQLANAFNKKMHEEVIGTIDLATLVDREIELVGAFTAGSSPVLVTPVRIQALEGGR